jgi:hypothetical protein
MSAAAKFPNTLQSLIMAEQLPLQAARVRQTARAFRFQVRCNQTN